MFVNSRQALTEVLEDLKPGVIIVVGKTLRNHLAQHREYFNFDTAPYVLCYWNHPSSPKYFKAAEAATALEKAKQKVFTSLD